MTERAIRILLPLRARARVIETPEGELVVELPELVLPAPLPGPTPVPAPSPGPVGPPPIAPEKNWLKLYPVTGRLGDDRSAWGAGPHSGVDWGAPCGRPIYALKPLTIVREGLATDGKTGIFAAFRYDDGVFGLVAHLSTTVVDRGQRLNVGDQIGTVGTTGASSGCHIHYELHDHDGSWGTLRGVIDPLSYHRDLIA